LLLQLKTNKSFDLDPVLKLIYHQNDSYEKMKDTLDKLSSQQSNSSYENNMKLVMLIEMISDTQEQVIEINTKSNQ